MNFDKPPVNKTVETQQTKSVEVINSKEKGATWLARNKEKAIDGLKAFFVPQGSDFWEKTGDIALKWGTIGIAGFVGSQNYEHPEVKEFAQYMGALVAVLGNIKTVMNYNQLRYERELETNDENHNEIK